MPSNRIQNHDVIIVGAGPTGLMLAAELAIARIDVVIIEKRPTQNLPETRAGGLHAETLAILDQRGVVDRFLSAGKTGQISGFGWFPLDISDFPIRHNYGLILPQDDIERILAAWVEELGVPIHRSRAVAGFTQDDAGIDIALSNDTTVHATYLVGCDGGRSLIRKAAGIDFPGWDASISNLLAEVYFAEDPEWGLRRDAHGISGIGKMENGAARVMLTERGVSHTTEPTLQVLSDALVAVYGTDYGVHSPRSVSRFTDMARQAATYRNGRVLLAGDAAHVHYPTGGQGLNAGMQDAFNLGWKLAQVVRGTSPDTLLDTYHAERHPVAAAILQNTMSQVALLRTDDRTTALRDILARIIAMDEPRHMLGAMISGLDVHYDLGDGHPLLGRRMPDLDLSSATGERRIASLLHDARPVLLSLGAPGWLDTSRWSGRVHLVDARYSGEWQLPVIGQIPAPTAVLIRPDGFVAWVGDRSTDGLTDALTTWFGHPAPETKHQ